MDYQFLDQHTKLIPNVDTVAIKRSQELPSEYLDRLKDDYFASQNSRAGEYHRVASIPVSVADHWLRTEGFDVQTAPIKETLRRLRRDGLEHFITSAKSV